MCVCNMCMWKERARELPVSASGRERVGCVRVDMNGRDICDVPIKNGIADIFIKGEVFPFVKRWSNKDVYSKHTFTSLRNVSI